MPDVAFVIFGTGMERMEFEQKVRNFIAGHDLLRPDDKVCVGLSGGADSVTLLTVLKNLGFDVMAVHVNHNLRGAESDADELFVRQLCGKMEVELFVYSYDIRRLAGEEGTGEEETGRMARHEAYSDCVANHGATVIALAHHANDLAETFLFHASRGSSLRGLAGIRPSQVITPRWISRGNDHSSSFRVVRPLLAVTRKEIEQYLTDRGQTWRTDSTNAETDAARNRLRNDVIPYLEKNINSAAVRHICDAAEDIAEADEYLRAEAEKRESTVLELGDPEDAKNAETAPAVRKSGAVFRRVLIRDNILKEPPVLRNYILMDAVTAVSGSAKDIGRMQLDQICDLFGSQTGSRLDLPYGVTAFRDYGGVTLIADGGSRDGSPDDPVKITGDGIFSWNGWKFRCEITDAQGRGPDKIERFTYTKFFDYDRILEGLVVRKRFRGDRITVTPEGGTKKISDYLINEKVPARERDSIPLLASGSRVHWVVGFRISEDAKVTAETKRILRIDAEPPGGRP
jgi:tRNA(Ile)-lysidine synthase